MQCDVISVTYDSKIGSESDVYHCSSEMVAAVAADDGDDDDAVRVPTDRSLHNAIFRLPATTNAVVRIMYFDSALAPHPSCSE